MNLVPEYLTRMIKIKSYLGNLIAEPEAQNIRQYSIADKIGMMEDINNILSEDDGILKDETRSRRMTKSEREFWSEMRHEIRMFISERLSYTLAIHRLIVSQNEIDNENIKRMRNLYKDFTILTFDRILELLPKKMPKDNDLSRELHNLCEQYREDSNYSQFKNATQKLLDSELQKDCYKTYDNKSLESFRSFLYVIEKFFCMTSHPLTTALSKIAPIPIAKFALTINNFFVDQNSPRSQEIDFPQENSVTHDTGLT